jgi:hypothetical protein
MLNLISIITLLLSVFTSPVHTNNHIHATQETIDTIYYNEYTHSYDFDTTVKDGSCWTYEIYQSNTDDPEVLAELNKMCDNKPVTIYYNDNDSTNSEDWYCVGYKLN